MRDLSDFEKGFLMACASVVTMHNEETIAANVARELGLSWEQIQKAGFCEYDLNSLKAMQDTDTSDPVFAL